MGETVESDDYSDLYGDVELQLSSAISAIQAVSKFPVGDDGVYDNDDRNVGSSQESEEGVGGLIVEEGEDNLEEGVGEQEDGNGSESEDDFDILLNDDVDCDNGNGNVNVNGTGYVKDKFLSRGTGGKVGNDDDEYANVAENRGNFGVVNGYGGGGKGGRSGGNCTLQYNSAGYNSTTFPCQLKSNGSARVASCLSTFARDDLDSNGCTCKYEKSCIGSQSKRNFSLPHSRTILDVNIDTLEHKPWRNSEVDITDFFNFGFDEDSWKSYCNYLDRHRDRIGNLTGSALYNNDRRRKDHGAEVDHDYQQRALSFNCEISCRSEMLKGTAIQVEHGLGERQPSIDVRLPVHRDSDVVIEIPVQDLEEGHSNSYKVPFNAMTHFFNKASRNQEVGVSDAGDILYSSTSEDELLILEGPTQKSNPHRFSRLTSNDDGDSSHLDSDSCDSLHVSDANEEEVRVTKRVSDGLAEEVSSDKPEKSDGTGKPARTPKEKPESSDSQQRHCSSPSQSDYAGSRDSAYANPNKFHNLPKVVSQTFASELWESSKDSSNCVVSTRSDYNYVARSRSPVRRNLRFQHRRSSLKNHLDDDYPVHMSDENFYGGHYRAVDFHKQRKRHHNFDYYRDKDYLYREGLTYQGVRFPSKTGSGFAGYSHGKYKDCRYKRPRYTGGNMKGKELFPEQRTQSLGDEVMQRKWNYRKQFYVQEMGSSDYDVSGELIAEDNLYLYNGDRTQSKRKPTEFYTNRKIESDEFSPEHNCGKKFTQENYQTIPDNWRDRDYLERRHERELSYTRGEAKNTLMNTKRYGNPFHDREDIWHTNSEDESSRDDRDQWNESSRYYGNRLYFHSHREPQTVFRGQNQMRPASLSRNGMIGRHGRQERQNCVERYRGSNKLDGYAGGYSVQHIYDHDSYVVGRSKNWESEVFHWSDQENDRHREDDMEAVVTSYHYGWTSSYKKFDSRPGPSHGRKLIDGRESSKRRYKLPIVGDWCSQFDRHSIGIYRNNMRQAPPSCWDPADSHIFYGNGKSSSCSKAGNLMYYDRDDILDWNDELECETMNGFSKSDSQKVIQFDRPSIDGFHNNANWPKKFSVTDDLNYKSRRKDSVVHHSINAEELEKPRIMEILAKMEKRRERFQQPPTSKNVEDMNPKPVADSHAEAKIQRPARKRKWGWQLKN